MELLRMRLSVGTRKSVNVLFGPIFVNYDFSVLLVHGPES